MRNFVLDRSRKRKELKKINMIEFDIVDSNGYQSILRDDNKKYWMYVEMLGGITLYPMKKVFHEETVIDSYS